MKGNKIFDFSRKGFQDIINIMTRKINECVDMSNEMFPRLDDYISKVDWNNIINSDLYQNVLGELDKTKEQLDNITHIVKDFLELRSGMYNKVFINNNTLNNTFLISGISNATIDFRDIEILLKNGANCYGVKIENCDNLTIKGLNFNGNGDNQSKKEGYLGFGVYITNCSNIQIDNLKIKNTLMYAFYGDNLYNITLNNPIVDQGNIVTYRNQDGLHFGGNTNYIYINNPVLKTWDDAIAFVTTNYTHGNISNIFINNVKLNGSINGIRFIMADRNIDNVVINGITGTVSDYLVSATNYTFEGVATGVLSRLTIDNVNVNMLNKIVNNDVFEFSGNIQYLNIDNCYVYTPNNRLLFSTKKELVSTNVILNNIEFYSNEKLTSIIEFDNSTIDNLKTNIIGCSDTEQVIINNTSTIKNITSTNIKGIVLYGNNPIIKTLNRKIYFDFFKSFTESLTDEILIMNNVKDDYKEIVDNHIKFKSNFVGVVNISCYSSVQQTLQIKKNGEVLSEYQIIGNKDINYVLNAKQLEQISFIIKAPRSGVFEIKTLIQ